jgi:hypothetical protein
VVVVYTTSMGCIIRRFCSCFVAWGLWGNLRAHTHSSGAASQTNPKKYICIEKYASSTALGLALAVLVDVGMTLIFSSQLRHREEGGTSIYMQYRANQLHEFTNQVQQETARIGTNPLAGIR